MDRIGHSALYAALHPGTWVPALGATVFAIDRFDQKVSDWAGDETPVFGSKSTARDVSNILLGTMGGLAAASIVWTPTRRETKGWVKSKGKGFLIQGCAIGSALGLTTALKSATGRMRPDRSDSKSFPSGHATAGFGLAALTSENLAAIPLQPRVRTGLKAATYATAVAVGWARVESQSHFPSDVLAGAAIGHFLTVFVQQAFLGSGDRPGSLELEMGRSTAGGFLVVRTAF